MNTVRSPKYAMRLRVRILQALVGVFYLCPQFLWRLLGTEAVESARKFNVGGPIVAIWAHPSDSSHPACGGRCEYVKAAYVDWLASTGVRSLPIRFNATPEEWMPILHGVNGLLLPGGTPALPDSARAAIKYVLDINKGGDFFPVWGTCLGWEWMAQAVAGNYSVLSGGFDGENMTLPWGLIQGVEETSRMLSGFSTGLLDKASRELITSYAHKDLVAHGTGKDCAVEDNMEEGISILPRGALSINADRKGREFISAAEAFQYPMYGLQWHPEKSQFVWGLDADGTLHAAINHSADAVELSQTLGNFFASETRGNCHAFRFLVEWEHQMFHNRPVTPTGPSTGHRYFLHWDDDEEALWSQSPQAETQ